MTPCEYCAQTRRRVRDLTVVVAVFIVLHALLIPLLPTLFEHALQASVGALVLGCVLLALVVTRRARSQPLVSTSRAGLFARSLSESSAAGAGRSPHVPITDLSEEDEPCPTHPKIPTSKAQCPPSSRN